MKKIKLFSLFAAMLLATSMWATIPMGSVDGVTGHNGSFHVWGWALDPDQPSTTVAIHVYIYPQGSTNPVKGYNAAVANLDRPDLKSSDPYSIGALYGTVHGFDCWIDITSEVPAGTYDVRVWPINVGSGEGNHTITYSNNGGDVKTITISNPYTVSYHANGGSGAPGAQRKVTNKNITLSNTTPTRAGYTFNGWNTASNGSGTNYAKGATYSANASATLYAKWNLVNYSISYTLNGGSVTGNPTSYNVTTNTFTLKNPTRTGYTFAGWTGSNGSTKQTSVTINKGSTGDKSYTANWTANTYTITLDWQGGATGDASKTATFGSATPTVNIPGRNGYSFGGYYTGKNGTGTQYLKPAANNTATSVRNWDIASNTTLYAKWNARTYTVTFDQQGGNGGTASTTATFDANMPSATMPSKTGYTFQGYYDATSEGTKYYNADGSSARTWNKTANTTLYARWAPVNYSITYNLDGGNATNPANYNIETATFTLNNPTKENNIFTGWTGSNGNEPQLEVSITQGSTGDKSFVAHWNEIPTPDPQQDPTIFAGFTATDGCGGFGGEGHDKLVDGLFAPGNEGVNWTKWCADGQHKSTPSGESESCWWVDFNSANPINVTGYILTTGNDNTKWGEGRNPNSWKIKAKLNAGDAWTTIATVTNDNTMQVADFTDFSFTLDQAGTYKYFRFMVYEPEYDNCMQLCEFRFTGNGGSTPEPADPEALQNELLQELWTALGEDVWTGYGTQTGVISYSRGGAEAFHASFMGGNYAFDLPFAAFTAASKAANTDGSYTYTLTCNLPAQTGMGQETLHVTLKNGEITGLESQNAGIEMNKEEEISGWASLQNAFAQGGVIKLAADVADSNNEGALVVPAGKTVMLELNGHIINRALTSAVADGSVIINNGTLAIMGEGQITGGKTTGNGGGILNNGVLTLYGGEITGNVAALGGGVYNNGGEQGFWMTGGLIKGNTATTHPAIGGEVIFNAQAVVQINADGDKVSIAEAQASMSTLAYVQPAMPNYDDLQPADPEALQNELLQELWTALGEDVWTGYGVNTGVISYSRGGAEAFHASFMGGNYAFDLPFAAFTAASKAANTDGSYTYTLTCNLPAQTGMGQETLHVTLKNGEITGLESQNAGIEMTKEEEISGWAALQNAFAQGGVIKLAADVADSNNEGALVVPAGKTVMLELNGHIINRALTSAVADGSVIINNGTLAIMGEGQITGGKTTGNGGGVLNNGIFTLYGGEITGNVAALGGGVYNNGGEQGFWMTGGLIKGNTATTHPAIGGDVIFNAQAVVQINADGDKVSIAEALASMSTLAYVQPAMPNYDDLQPADPEALQNELLQELWTALGEDVWTGYGTQTGVISYSRGGAEAFHASFMGGNYAFDLPFAAFTAASKAANTDGSYTYTLTCNLPAQTGMGQETLHVTLKNGEITGLESQNAGIEMQKEEGPVTGWAALQAAMTNGGVIKLGENVTAESTDLALTVPAGKTVVLELNGFNIDRALTSAVENGSVIVNNGTLAIMGEGQITGGKTTGNGGGILNKGIFTLYGGEITGNVAALGGGVYNNGGEQGFWMTGGLIKGNTATTHPAIGGEVIFNAQAVVQINADGDKVSIDEAIAGLATYDYIKPVMPDYDDYTTAVAIVANADPNNANVYYSTFFDSANKYLLPAGVEAYVADLSGADLLLTKIAGAGQVIPANVAVILKANVQNFSLMPSFEVPVSFTANNDLEGVDAITAVTSIDGLTTTNCYVLSGTNEYGVGFYRINSDNLKAHKAYVKYAGLQTNAPKRMRFVFNQEQTATGMEDVQGSVQTTKILRNDQIIIIRNGVEYTINGQKVK